MFCFAHFVNIFVKLLYHGLSAIHTKTNWQKE